MDDFAKKVDELTHLKPEACITSTIIFYYFFRVGLGWWENSVLNVQDNRLFDKKLIIWQEADYLGRS